MSHSSSDLAKCYLFPVFQWDLVYPAFVSEMESSLTCAKKVAFFYFGGSHITESWDY